MKRFLLADDHFVVRAGISFLIRQEYPTSEIDECEDGNAVWKKMEKQSYDLAILDISMPGSDSMSLLKNIFSIHPQQKVLILSMSPEEIYAKKYIHLGVKGFVSKSAGPVELRRAISTILSNKRYLTPKMKDLLSVEDLNEKKETPFDQLSARELEVLPHLLEGLNVTQIANILSVHTSTVGTHKARIFHKLGVTNLIELNRIAQLFFKTP
jgi:DNA-binding NarL/FixJ family response regulator